MSNLESQKDGGIINRNRHGMTAFFFFLERFCVPMWELSKLTFGRGGTFEDLAGIWVEMSNRPLGTGARS